MPNAPVSSSTDDALIEKAADAFWSVIARSFAELSSGDSQLSGEDEAALALWLTGDAGDRPIQLPRYDLPAPAWVSATRISAAVEAGMAAALNEWKTERPEDAIGNPSAAVITQLSSCVRHLLHLNLSDQQAKAA
jgi:hypothetical protein